MMGFLATGPGRALLGSAGGLLLLAGAYLWISNAAYQRGWDEALASVSKQNAAAADAAARVKVTVDHCYDKGGEWDASTGSCNL